ncbi:hypothetical protein BT63DRAFT_426713 [Microthyrium microscopicum]|uniref:DDHD domain-containing protein n=1 Tax=Microthyrium microscopicum TaxID=703497 RepID=A0A6A6U8D2_9PEZI|nr:hypothetical protein BT63DRAFT_426713 [Microthyrium microscopicum]
MSSSSPINPFARTAREIIADPPPPIDVRYFYTSLLAIDDPLSPLPPATTVTQPLLRQAPRPFSVFDNSALEKSWLQTREKLRQAAAESNNERQRSRAGTASSTAHQLTNVLTSLRKPERKKSYGTDSPTGSPRIGPRSVPIRDAARQNTDPKSTDGSLSGSLRGAELGDGVLGGESSTTRNPFVRAPDRSEGKDILGTSSKSHTESLRPSARMKDSYNWGEDTFGAEQLPSRNESKTREPIPEVKEEKSCSKVPVGVSRLHSVVFPDFQMVPIYWSPVKDVAPIQRSTWFYSETMMPVETQVANLLEMGYIEMQAWTDTWKDELNSAIEVGAAGEEKITHRLWPEKIKAPSRPSTSRVMEPAQSDLVLEPTTNDPEKERQEVVTTAEALIDLSTGPNGNDNKASGATIWGRDGTVRLYRTAGVIYANAKDAYILRPGLLPSAYKGRRPLANHIRKGKPVGIPVVRGFDEKTWTKLYPPKKGPKLKKAMKGTSSSEQGASTDRRHSIDPALALSDRPEVTDLVLVIHGIGQKLSERVESYHFTHAINAFRREANVELGDEFVKQSLRENMGGIMMLPVNWRLTLSFEDGGYRNDDEAPQNEFSLKDITPETLPSVRNIVSDVMLDIPYYLTTGYHDKMVAAVTTECNRIYHLWCQNNPGFEQRGRVHLVAHSLGSVMAIDILSAQPTHLQFDRDVAKLTPEDLPATHFAFDVHNLFMAGSPAGLFLLLKRSGLLPRKGRNKAGADYSDDSMPGVAGQQGTYGCLAVDNVYNVVNGYDPVAYCLNATVDADYAAALKPAFVPSSAASWFPMFNRAQSTAAMPKPSLILNRLPSNVEMETHDFTREEIAERKAYLLNDNGQIDYFLKYGGGPLEIQYLTMLGAHSSYWINRDFVRLLVTEIGRPDGRGGTLVNMRAVKKKKIPS